LRGRTQKKSTKQVAKKRKDIQKTAGEKKGNAGGKRLGTCKKKSQIVTFRDAKIGRNGGLSGAGSKKVDTEGNGVAVPNK